MWTVKGNGKNIKRQIIASFSSKRVGWLDILKEKTIQIYQQHGNRRMAVGLSEKDYGQISIPIVDN